MNCSLNRENGKHLRRHGLSNRGGRAQARPSCSYCRRARDGGTKLKRIAVCMPPQVPEHGTTSVLVQAFQSEPSSKSFTAIRLRERIRVLHGN